MSRIEQLNLARKWRSQNFDQLIGQELSVNMIKNSLYRQHFFPVYLFAGQRGCGKTSMARIFAAALNCEQLDVFSKKPKQAIIPCQTCPSCAAMQTGRHPDFIEIDAASHTGVDNVRQIIEASSLVPLMGRKKVYLIDEAHMLSKAAFNAFLKLLEEPPSSVLFILATTDSQKIIETVRSRCFQLFFKPVDHEPLQKHLEEICTKEKIACDNDALSLIIKETGGSVRDAINLLEQVRFSTRRVTKATVQEVLGHFDDARLIALFDIVLTQSPQKFLQFATEHNLHTYSVDFLWRSFIDLARASLWLKYGVTPNQFTDQLDALQKMLVHVSKGRITQLLEMLYRHEMQFLKTTSQYPLLEMILLQLCQKNDTSGNTGTPSQMSVSKPADDQEYIECDEEIDESDEEDEEDEDALGIELKDASLHNEKSPDMLWKEFISRVDSCNDPLVVSIFKQGIFDSLRDNKLVIHFSKDLSFFSDSLLSARATWEQELHDVFGKPVSLVPEFNREVEVKAVRPAPRMAATPSPESGSQQNTSHRSSYNQKNSYGSNSYNQKAPRINEPRIDISDKKLWKMTHMILQHFPGTVTQISEKTV